MEIDQEGVGILFEAVLVAEVLKGLMRCMMRYVANVARIARFPLDQVVTNRCTAVTALRKGMTEERKEQIEEDRDLVIENEPHREVEVVLTFLS